MDELLAQFEREMAAVPSEGNAQRSMSKLRAVRESWLPLRRDRRIGAGTEFRQSIDEISRRHAQRILTGKG